MKKLLFVVALALSLIGWGGQPAVAQGLNVLTTTVDLKSITEFIGKDRVEVDSLGTGDQNYHFLAAKPSYMVKARKADLFIRIGMDLEAGYESLILEGSRNKNIRVGRAGHLDVSAGIEPLEVPEAVDRSMGDIHAAGNPHYWLDPMNAKTIARTIAERLSQLSPQDRAFFEGNLAEFNRTLDAKMKEWQATLAPYKGERIITYHKSWIYFAKRFGLEVAGELEPKPGIPPTPTHLKSVVDLAREEKIKMILIENFYSPDSARFVAGKTQAKVVIAPISVGGMKGAQDYFLLMDLLVRKVAEGFAP